MKLEAQKLESSLHAAVQEVGKFRITTTLRLCPHFVCTCLVGRLIQARAPPQAPLSALLLTSLLPPPPMVPECPVLQRLVVPVANVFASVRSALPRRVRTRRSQRGPSTGPQGRKTGREGTCCSFPILRPPVSHPHCFNSVRRLLYGLPIYVGHMSGLIVLLDLPSSLRSSCLAALALAPSFLS